MIDWFSIAYAAAAAGAVGQQQTLNNEIAAQYQQALSQQQIDQNAELMRQYEQSQGEIIDLGPDDVRVIEDVPLLGEEK